MIVFIISGPVGSGKSRLAGRLMQRGTRTIPASKLQERGQSKYFNEGLNHLIIDEVIWTNKDEICDWLILNRHRFTSVCVLTQNHTTGKAMQQQMKIKLYDIFDSLPEHLKKAAINLHDAYQIKLPK